MGFRVSAAGWYDDALQQPQRADPRLEAGGSYDNNTYSSFTKRYYNGPPASCLDAFVFGNFEVAGRPVRLKLGKHSLFWGDRRSTRNHSVAYSQMPNDTRKQLNSPWGSRLRKRCCP